MELTISTLKYAAKENFKSKAMRLVVVEVRLTTHVLKYVAVEWFHLKEHYLVVVEV